MSDQSTIRELPVAVRRALAALRRRFRAYVWLEGLATIIATLGIAFWLGLAIDWTFEPSPAVRRFGLVAVGCIALYVCYRYLLRRLFVRISDKSASVLLERRFPELKDHLITAVDVASSPERAGTFHADLVAQTNAAANAAIAGVAVGEVFNRRPLVRSVLAAAALVVSIVVFAILSHDVFGFWLQRVALSDAPWPRRVHLEVVGFPQNAHGVRTHKLAQDDDFELLVHADALGYEVPDEVEIRYRLADGRRGRDTLVRVGEANATREPFQLFRYEFKHITGNMSFDVVGGDDRVRDLHLQVVDRPELVAIELECEYPKYLHRSSRRLPVTGGMRIPEGSRLVLHASSTKPLTAVRFHAAKDKHDTNLTFTDQHQKQLAYDYGRLSADDVLLVSITDSDGVSTREPYRISLSAVKDEVPQVAVRLSGISTAITPDAVLPFVGKITDDYALDRAWYEYQVDAGPVVKRPLAEQPRDRPALDKINPFDTRALESVSGKRALQLKPKQRLTLTLKASDQFDLAKGPRAGSSQPFVLDVVTPADLLALMERRELSLRQRFESIYEKLTDTRNLLSRVGSDEKAESSSGTNAKKSDVNGDNATASETTSAERVLSRTRLRVAGSLQNVVQSTDEVIGVAEAFDDMGQELANNRIDNPDLKNRLGEQIAKPLHKIASQSMPQLTAQLKLVEGHIEDPVAMAPELKKAIAQSDQILVEMKQVLNRMLELENYNEVVALLRDIISDQEQINHRTKEQQKERLRSLFQD
ncbi:MAG TPA: hypothetical protein VFW73_00770 [Lacipirellulaceae bacterium]|nr:hypothetical protein [Lacipirellulaceae bacterium]